VDQRTASTPSGAAGRGRLSRLLDKPAPRETIGWLVVRGPAGLLDSQRRWLPGEWRALRRQLKEDVIGRNVARALRTLDETPSSIVVVGGPAATRRYSPL
jgi:hypothetical protein